MNKLTMKAPEQPLDAMGQPLHVGDIVVIFLAGLVVGKIKKIHDDHTHPITIDGYNWQRGEMCLKLNDIDKAKLALWTIADFKSIL